MKKINACKSALTAFMAAVMVTTFVQAQVAVSDEARDACVKDEMVSKTVKGAGLGAMAGIGAALFSNKKEDALKKAAIGAAVGSAAGFATAYLTANDNCNKKNPNWIPESKIVRGTQNYEEVKRTTKYKPSEGIKAEATKLVMPSSTTAGSEITLESSFYVLTPKGEETEVTIERKLFAMEAGKESVNLYGGHQSERLTFQPGENKDIGHLKIAAKTQAGTQFRYEFSVSAGGKPASTVQGTVTVE
jgi:hypothetical protein